MPENRTQKDISDGIDVLEEIRWLLDSWMEFRRDHPKGISPDGYLYSCPGHNSNFQVEPSVYKEFNRALKKPFVELAEIRKQCVLARISDLEKLPPLEADLACEFGIKKSVWNQLSPVLQHMLRSAKLDFGDNRFFIDVKIPDPFLRIGSGEPGGFRWKRYVYPFPDAELPPDLKTKELFLARCEDPCIGVPLGKAGERFWSYCKKVFKEHHGKQMIEQLKSEEQSLRERIAAFEKLTPEEQELWVIDEYGACATLQEIKHNVKQKSYYRRAVERTRFHKQILRFPQLYGARWRFSVGKPVESVLEGYKDFLSFGEVLGRVKDAMAGLQDVILKKFAERPPWGYSTNLIPQGDTLPEEFKAYENLRMQIREYRAEKMGLIGEDLSHVDLDAQADLQEDDSWPDPIALPEELRSQGPVVSEEKTRIPVDLVERDKRLYWNIDGEEQKPIVRGQLRTISLILFNEMGRGYIPHRTFFDALGLYREQYFEKIRKPLSRLKIEFRVPVERDKKEGLRLPENWVKTPPMSK